MTPEQYNDAKTVPTSASAPTSPALNSNTPTPEPTEQRTSARLGGKRPNRRMHSNPASVDSRDAEEEAEEDLNSDLAEHDGEHDAENDAEQDAEHDNASPTRESQKPPQRARASLACVACRRRKIRCDGVMPECRNCRNSSRECIYVKVRNTPAARVRSEKRLDLIESKLAQIMDALEKQQTTHQKALAATEANLIEKLGAAARLATAAPATAPHVKPEPGLNLDPESSRLLKRARGDNKMPEEMRHLLSTAHGGGSLSSPPGSNSGTDGEGDEAMASVARSGGVGVVAGDKGATEDTHVIFQDSFYNERQFSTQILAAFFSPRALRYLKERIGDEQIADRLWSELHTGLTQHLDGCFTMASQLTMPGVIDPAFLDLCLYEYKQIGQSVIWQIVTPDEAMAARQHPDLYGMHAVKSGDTLIVHAVAAFIANSMVLDGKVRAVSNEYIMQQGNQALTWGLWCAARAPYFESHITGCRGMLLVLLALFKFPVEYVVYEFCSSLVRQACDIGLNRESFYRGRTPDEAERRRVLWCLICVCDGQYSTHFGFKPVVRPTDNSVELPPAEKPGEYTDLLSGRDSMKLCEIWSRMYERLYSASVETKTRIELMESVLQCDEELREWKENLPQVCRVDDQGKVDKNVPEHLRWCAIGILNMHVMYNELQVLVHRHSLALRLPLREHLSQARAHASGRSGSEPPAERFTTSNHSSEGVPAQSILICAASARNMLLQSAEIIRLKRSVDVGVLLTSLNALGTLLIKGVIRPDDQNVADAELIRSTFSFLTEKRQRMTSAAQFLTSTDVLGNVVADVLASMAKNRANPRQRKRRRKPTQPQMAQSMPAPLSHQPQPPQPQQPQQSGSIQYMGQPGSQQNMPQPWHHRRLSGTPQHNLSGTQHQRNLSSTQHQRNLSANHPITYGPNLPMMSPYGPAQQQTSSQSPHGGPPNGPPVSGPMMPEMHGVGPMSLQMGQNIYREGENSLTEESLETLDDYNDEILDDIDLQFASDMVFVPANLYGYREML